MNEVQAVAHFLQTGTAEAFCLMFGAVYNRVKRYFVCGGLDEMTAEDLAQNVLLKVYKHANKLNRAENFDAWLFKIARNELISHHRKTEARIELVERMRLVEGQFKRAISAARRQITLRDDQIYRGLRGVFLRLVAEESEPEADQRRIIEQWLRALETALADLCGNHTAVRVLHVSAKNSPARSLDRVEAGNWQPFFDQLTLVTQVVCGEIGAQLVGEIGRFTLNLSMRLRNNAEVILL